MRLIPGPDQCCLSRRARSRLIHVRGLAIPTGLKVDRVSVLNLSRRIRHGAWSLALGTGVLRLLHLDLRLLHLDLRLQRRMRLEVVYLVLKMLLTDKVSLLWVLLLRLHNDKAFPDSTWLMFRLDVLRRRIVICCLRLESHSGRSRGRPRRPRRRRRKAHRCLGALGLLVRSELERIHHHGLGVLMRNWSPWV
jgi:hypothetical protein